MPAWDTVPHVLFSFHGGLPGGEIWTVGLRTTRVDAGIDSTIFDNVAQGAANAFGTFVTDTGTMWAAGVTYAGVTARSLDPAGLTVRLAEKSPAVPPAPASLLTCPDQVCLAVTLLTARAGRTGKGRFYLPMLTNQAGGTTTGRVPAGNANVVGTAAVTLINTLNLGLLVFTGAPKIGVQSGTESANADGGYDGAAVTAVSVGDVLDTQRRRRSSLKEVYQTHPVA